MGVRWGEACRQTVIKLVIVRDRQGGIRRAMKREAVERRALGALQDHLPCHAMESGSAMRMWPLSNLRLPFRHPGALGKSMSCRWDRTRFHLIVIKLVIVRARRGLAKLHSSALSHC